MSPDGSKIFVTGSSWGPEDTDYLTIAYAQGTGAQLWSVRYDGPANGFDWASAIAVGGDGSTVFVTGQSDGMNGHRDYATVAYSAATGTQLWSARYNAPGNYTDNATSLAVSPDGSKVFVTGSSWSGSHDYLTAAYASDTGAQLWTARYDGGLFNWANSLAVSPDGSKVLVTGRSLTEDLVTYDFATVAYSASTGAQLWAARYNAHASSDDRASFVAVSPDGSTTFVTGPSSSDYATLAYDSATGAQVWVARYNGPADAEEWAHSLVVTADGSRVLVTGESDGLGSFTDYATVAYGSDTGAQLWVARYNGPANSDDVPTSIAVSPDGSTTFVTGRSLGVGSADDYADPAYVGVLTGQGYDYATVAYSSATGARLWSARYNGSANSHDLANAIAVSSDGSKIFVTGQSDGRRSFWDSRYDYATIAYRPTSCAGGKDESGHVSGSIHDRVEPVEGSTIERYVHGVNCDVVVENGF